MLNLREIQSPEKFLDLLDKAYESSAFLSGYLSGMKEYIGRLPFTEGDKLRAVAARAGEVAEEFEDARRRLRAVKTLFPTIETAATASRPARKGTFRRKPGAASKEWARGGKEK